MSCAHNGARLADINGDGRDEVLGATILSSDGKVLAEAAEFHGHIDSLFVADVLPEMAGSEVVLLEEGSNQVQVVGSAGPIWRKGFKRQEPQNAAIGRFSKDSDEVFIWCRSRYPEHQKPFVFSSSGQVVSASRPWWRAAFIFVAHWRCYISSQSSHSLKGRAQRQTTCQFIWLRRHYNALSLSQKVNIMNDHLSQ